MNGSHDVMPERLAENVIARFQESNSEIAAYWMKVDGNREEYATRVQQALSNLPIVVLIVRDASFNNPNAIAADLVGILEANREACEAVLFPEPLSLNCGVILLGRTPLSVPQSSSPVRLPRWFPTRAGQIATLFLEDLTWVTDAPLNCPEARVAEICEQLYGLEGALVACLAEANGKNHNTGNAFMEIIRQEGDGKYSALLSDFDTYHTGITVPSSFRPSLREGRSVIGRLWRIVQGRPPEGLHAPSKALAKAVGLSETSLPDFDSFAAVLSRPSTRDDSSAVKFMRNVLTTVASACQFATAASHADQYSRYPVQLLVSFSYDLRKSLAAVEQVLREAIESLLKFASSFCKRNLRRLHSMGLDNEESTMDMTGADRRCGGLRN